MAGPDGNEESNKIKTPEEINQAIRELKKKSNRIKISGLSGQDSIAVGLDKKVELRLSGNVGKYFGALNNGAVITLKGNSGPFTGNNMLDGGIIILGDLDSGAALNMRGGIIVAKGTCRDDVGEFMSGGTLIVDGDVNGDLGDHMYNGTIIINGRIKGRILNNALGGTLYTLDRFDTSSNNLREMKISENDQVLLKSYFEHYALEALPSSFRKYSTANVKQKGWRPW